MVSLFNIKKIVHLIDNNGIIAYPTESVFGLGCDPLSKTAVQKILTIKNRTINKGFIIVASSVTHLVPWIQPLDDKIWDKIVNTKATNWVVPSNKSVPKWIIGEHCNIAIRLSCHPVITQLCNALNHPLVSTSANITGRPALRNSIQVRKQLGNDLDYIITGKSGGLTPCPIVNIRNHTIIRP